MKAVIRSLTVENFKGFDFFSLVIDGKNADVTGANATGKTSLYDGFLWLFTDKDSQGRSNFEVKPLNKDGVKVEGLEPPTVTAEMDFDGEIVEFKKSLLEKWVRPRGKAEPEFKGNEFKYWIDGEPVKKKKWDARLENFVQGDFLRLLTNPFYFASMAWKERRNLLVKVCGDVTDADVIASSEALAGLPELLGRYSVDARRAVISEDKAKKSKRKGEVPARIDELKRSVESEDSRTVEEIKERIAFLESSVGANGVAGKKQELKRAEKALDQARKRADGERRDNTGLVDYNIRKKKGEIERLDEKEKDCVARVESARGVLENAKTELQDLRGEYRELSQKKPQGEKFCPYCEAELSGDKLQEAMDRARADIAKELEKINERGKNAKERVEREEKEITRLQAEIEAVKKDRESARKEVALLEVKKKEAADARNEADDEADAEIERIERLRAEIEAAEKGEGDTTELEKSLCYERDCLAGKQNREKVAERISELKAEEKELAQAVEALEKEEALLDLFIKTKVEMLEDKINGFFDFARFRMYEVYNNGNVSEACEILYNGVPFHSGLNRGAQINVGLDIIRALSLYYGVSLPVWVDNAEAVSELADPGGQVVGLYVAPAGEGLRVRVK